MIPLVHDFAGETVLIFGAGPVGARKARLFAGEARVVVVGPDFPDDDYDGADRIRAAPTPAEIPEWFDRVAPILAVAATDDPAVNEAIETTAAECGVLYNRADVSGGRAAGSVVVPATIEDGEVTVAVTTGANSPALARELRERIEPVIEGAGELARLSAALRDELKDCGVEAEARREAVSAVVRSPAVWKDLGTGGSNARRTADAVVESALGEQE